MSQFLDKMNWRYATKSFDTSKKISQEDLDEIIEVFRLTPSSFGLEPWKLIVIENPEIRKTLKEHSWGQAQITDSSHLLVFARKTIIDDNYIDGFLDNNSIVT
ncbi:MAG: nitroreductase family protein [Patescibacteria group bacterium]|nr:nitroreductase family protein [Patescibacteria group bacterium]